MCGEDDARGMVNDIKGVRSLGGRDVKVHKGWDLCLRDGDVGYGNGVGGGCGVDGSDEGDRDGDVDGSGGNSGVGESGESGVYRSGGGDGSLVHRSV